MSLQLFSTRVARLRLGGRPTLSGVGDVTEEGPAAGVLAGVREEGAVLEMAWEGREMTSVKWRTWASGMIFQFSGVAIVVTMVPEF